MLSSKMFAVVTAMMIAVVSAAAVKADLAQAAAPVVDKAAVHAAASGAAETSEKAKIASNGMDSSVHDAAPVERGGYGGYPYYPWYPPYPVYYGKGKGKGKWRYRAYNADESGANVASGDMEASVHVAAPVERGGYGGYPYYPRYPPYPVYYGKGKGKGKWRYRAYNGHESGANVASGDMEASVRDATPVERGGYGGGYPGYPYYPPYYPLYYGKGKGKKGYYRYWR
jgi:hypothetical protein